MANFTNFITDVNINPDRGLKTSYKPRVLSAKYGDGYEQRVSDGINTLTEEWSLTWKNRSRLEPSKIILFFEVLKGLTSFDWYPTGLSTSGITTSILPNHLVDSSQSFTSRYLNTTVSNNTDSTQATVLEVVSNTSLRLSNDIMALEENYTINPYKKYICKEWDNVETFQGYNTITAKFTQVNEP